MGLAKKGSFLDSLAKQIKLFDENPSEISFASLVVGIIDLCQKNPEILSGLSGEEVHRLVMSSVSRRD
jgi:hypothetical protein